MVVLSQKPMQMTEDDYLVFERESEMKHEFLDGEVLAMSGGSRSHNRICVNLIRLLSTQLQGGECEVFSSDMRVKIASGKYTYPDLSVVCGEPQFSDDDVDNLLNPTLIIEVLSPSTEGYDRGKKFQHYRAMPSLKMYLLVAQDQPCIEQYILPESGIWRFSDVTGLESHLNLDELNCELNMSEVYERVSFSDE